MTTIESTEAQGRVIPATLRWASIALAAYALLVVVNPTVLQAMNDWAGIAQYLPALIRAVGVALVVWGLLRHAVWAWWLAVVLAVFWLVTGVFELATILSLLEPPYSRLPPGFFVTVSITVVLLAAAIILLCVPSTRAAFRQKAG